MEAVPFDQNTNIRSGSTYPSHDWSLSGRH